MAKTYKDVAFPLYVASKEIIKRVNDALDELGLTYTQYIALSVLNVGVVDTVKEVGGVLYLDSGTLTPLFKKLENKGLVTRRRSNTDERQVVVKITNKGRTLYKQAEAALDGYDFKEQLSETKIQTLSNYLGEMLAGFET